MILVGGGGHARVVGEAVLANVNHYTLLGFVDPVPVPQTASILGVPQLGDDTAIEHHGDAALVLGIGAVGAPHARHEAVTRLGTRRRWITLVHPAAYISPSAHLEEGVVVLPQAMLHAGARAGAHSLVNSGATVEHDVVLGTHVLIGPGVVVGAEVIIGDAAFVGVGAIIRNRVRIGAGAIVGMGAVVVRDVPPGAMVLGNPARTRVAGSV